MIETGIARLTSTTQYFLDTCPAVKSWRKATADEFDTQFDPTVEYVAFDYDTEIEVPVVPAGVYFDPAEAE